MLQFRYPSPVSRQHLPPPLPPPTFHQQPHYREELPLNGFAFPGSPDPAWPPVGPEQGFRLQSSSSILPGQWPDHSSVIPSTNSHRSPSRHPALQQILGASAGVVGLDNTSGSLAAAVVTPAATLELAAVQLELAPAAGSASPGSGTSSPTKRKRASSGTGQQGSAFSSRGSKSPQKPSRFVLCFWHPVEFILDCALPIPCSSSWKPALITAALPSAGPLPHVADRQAQQRAGQQS
jgi:hypothetical protein